MVKASIIVPTKNRANLLTQTIRSLVEQDFSVQEYEVLIVDNDSTDETRNVAQNLIEYYNSPRIGYIHESEPGLLSGRHRGSLESHGEILIFVDDDIEAEFGWLSAIIEAFDDSKVHLVGGPSLPKFEVEPPAWLSKFWVKVNSNITCGPLSISFLGNEKKEVDPCSIWGLNFAIRKNTLFKLGGFHPDCIPKNLQHFQGDGESGLTLKAKQKNLKATYAPKALVHHNIPKERLTVSYFEERNYYQGVCDSYTQIRQHGGIGNFNLPKHCKNDHQISHLPAYDQYKQIIYDRIHNAYVDGFIFHQDAVKKSEILLEWVLRDNYLFDYSIPTILSSC
jgi:glycosyltransferase involved in cell wall biosynthesis